MHSRSAAVTKTLAALALALGTLPLVSVSTAGAATGSADASAQAPLSRVHNRTNLTITARKNWTCGWGTTGSSSTECVGGGTRTVAAYDKTPLTEDWDVVQVDAGWCYKIKFVIPFKEWTLTFNQVGQGNRYVKVEDHADAYVTSQNPGSC